MTRQLLVPDSYYMYSSYNSLYLREVVDQMWRESRILVSPLAAVLKSGGAAAAVADSLRTPVAITHDGEDRQWRGR